MHPLGKLVVPLQQGVVHLPPVRLPLVVANVYLAQPLVLHRTLVVPDIRQQVPRLVSTRN